MSSLPRPEPDPRFGRPSPAPASRPGDPALPPPRLPPTKWRQERERAAVRKHIHQHTPFLREVKPPTRSTAKPLEKVPFLRHIARRALFSPEHPSRLLEPQAPAAVKDIYGELRLYGHRLSWWDARTLAWVFYEFRAQPESARRRRELWLPARRLATELNRPNEPGQRAVDRARASLLRLTQAQFSFTFPVSEREELTVGTPQQPETFLRRDPAQHADDVFVLSGWLHQLLLRGIDKPASGLLQYGIEWAMLRAFERRQLLLYQLLECHNWDRARQSPCPFDPDSGVETRTWYWLLKPPFLRALGLDGYADMYEVRRQLQRITDAISARDYRYNFALDDSGERLLVWRDRSRTERWTGALCRRCYRPDPNQQCCCVDVHPCGQEACARCRR